MKSIYSPALIQLLKMKEQPPDGTTIEWVDNVIVGMNVPDQSGFAIVRNGIVESPVIKPPFRPGEKRYLAEHLHRDRLWVTYADGQPALNVAGIHERWEWMMSRRILPPQSMPLKFARRFFTIVSCMPMRVSEVTEEDAIKAGFIFDEHNQIMACENLENWWQSKHPGKEWMWRIEIREEKK